MMWANVELVMEMHVRRLLDITVEQACIVCGPLGGGAKLHLLSSLATAAGELGPLLEAIRAFQIHAGRNALAHGFTTFETRKKPWFVVSREVKRPPTHQEADVASLLQQRLHACLRGCDRSKRVYRSGHP